MSWEFEHWDDGKVYLHEERWEEFRKNVDKYGQGYPHNWNHNRFFICIHTPRDSILDLPARGEDGLKHQIATVQELKMIYESYPAFIRTDHDPEGWLPSWHMWAEDKYVNGESISILTSVNIFWKGDDPNYISFRRIQHNVFAKFRNQFWNVKFVNPLGIGPNEPPEPPIKKKPKLLLPRSIFDSFEESW